MVKNSETEYGAVAKVLHWLVALLVIGLFAVGVWMVELGYYDDWYHDAPYYHKSVGITLAVLLVFRIVWRWKKGVPKALDTQSQLEKRLGKVTHFILYVMMIALVLSGYFISTADGRGIEVFGIFSVPSSGELIANQEDIAGQFHKWLAYLLIALVAVHLIAALKHHLVDKDETLKRIL